MTANGAETRGDGAISGTRTSGSGRSDYRLGLVFVSGSALAWSLAGLFTRLIHLDVWTMLAWRGLFGAMGMAVVVVATEGRRTARSLREMGFVAWTFAGTTAVGMVFFIAALRRTSVAHVAVIYATVPLFAAVLGWLTVGERPSGGASLASLAALFGVAVMVGFGAEGDLLGDVLALGMTVAMAAMIVIARRFRTIPVMPAACLSALLSGLACWPLGRPLAVSWTDLLLLALFGLVNSALGLALFTRGAGLLPATETALIGALDAPLAPLWVWLAFDEVPSGTTMIGAAVVFVAVGAHIVLAALATSE